MADKGYEALRNTVLEHYRMREPLHIHGSGSKSFYGRECQGEKLSLDHQMEIDAWFATNPAAEVIGAFEGAGYMSEGMYRSQLDCIMFTKGVKPFCAACRRGIVEIIQRYGE